jgi:hypothetical protein
MHVKGAYKFLNKDNALLQFSQTSALRGADNAKLESLRYLVGGRGAAHEPGLTDDSLKVSGNGSKVWGDPHVFTMPTKTLSGLILNLFRGFFVYPILSPTVCKNEFKETLIVPSPGRQPDTLTQWVLHSYIPLCDRLRKIYNNTIHGGFSSWLRSSRNRMDMEHSSLDRNTTSDIGSTTTTATRPMVMRNLSAYGGDRVMRVISRVTTTVACLFPTIAIIILARVRTIGMTLGLIALFTAMFALGLVLLSSGSSRMQIFTATSV